MVSEAFGAPQLLSGIALATDPGAFPFIESASSGTGDPHAAKVARHAATRPILSARSSFFAEHMERSVIQDAYLDYLRRDQIAQFPPESGTSAESRGLISTL